MLFRGLLPIGVFFFVYWLLGTVAWLRPAGWPRRLRWLGAAIVAAWMIALFRGGLLG